VSVDTGSERLALWKYSGLVPRYVCCCAMTGTTIQQNSPVHDGRWLHSASLTGHECVVVGQ